MHHDSTTRPSLSAILNGDGADLRRAWDSTEAAKDFAPLPAGKYVAHLSDISLAKASTGTPSVKLEFRIIDGEHKGRKLWADLWLTAPALPQTKRDLLKLRITELAMLETIVVPQNRIRCDVTVALRRDDAGVERNHVKRFDVVAIDEPPAPDAFAPDTMAAAAPEPAASDTPAAAPPPEANTEAALVDDSFDFGFNVPESGAESVAFGFDMPDAAEWGRR